MSRLLLLVPGAGRVERWLRKLIREEAARFVMADAYCVPEAVRLKARALEGLIADGSVLEGDKLRPLLMDFSAEDEPAADRHWAWFDVNRFRRALAEFRRG